MKYSDEKRLFAHLKINDQRRQVIFNSGADDDFFVNLEIGAIPIDQAITTYLLDDEKESKYDYVLVLDRQVGSTILRPLADKKDMSSQLDVSVQSHDRKQGNRQSVTFQDEEDDISMQPRRQREAEQKAIEAIHDISGSDEQQLLGRINQLVKKQTNRHFAIVYMYPDTMLLSSSNSQDHIDKMRLISEWSHLPNCDSFIILDEHRQAEFNKLLDWVWNNDDYSKSVNLARPGKDELSAFLKRAVCRHGLFCTDVNTIATTAAAEGTSLRNFAVRLKNYVMENPDNIILDRFYSDDSKVRSLEDVRNLIDRLVGLENVKEYVRELCKTVEDNEKLAREGKERHRLQPLPHFMFLGSPGTGKTTVARLLGQLFLNLGLRTRNAFVEISFADLVGDSSKSPVEVMMAKVHDAMGGVLFVDEVYLLTEDQGGRMALQTLIKEMEDKRDSFTVIMAGYAEKLPELYKVNPGFESRISKLTFNDYSTDELTQMVVSMLGNADYTCTKVAVGKIELYIESRQLRGGLGNGRGARTLFEKICERVRLDNPNRHEVQELDIPIPMCLHPKEAEKIIHEFEESFAGIPRVKKFIYDMYKKQLDMEKRQADVHRKGDRKLEPNNCFFLGNPGTGKTTAAKKMGKLFHWLGLVSEDKFKEVDPIQAFTSSYVGEYAQKVKDVFDDALGGVLFIDEAYQLANDEQGRKALDQIVKMTTEPRYLDMIIIMAGYPDEMQKLSQCNPGLKRRFPNQVYFDDFSNDELVDIFMKEVADSDMHVRKGEEDSFHAHLRSILARMAAERHFGNAGAVKNFFNTVVLGNFAERWRLSEGADEHELWTSDLQEKSVVARPFAEIMKEVNAKYVGLETVKEHIMAVANRIRVGRLRAIRLHVPTLSGSNHTCLVGNVGTGKKSMAGYMAEIFCSLGIVSHPKLRIWRGIDLKGSYVGQTKDKVNKMFEDSPDSVILIDEIYGLAPEGVSNQDSFGMEAVDAIAGGLADAKNATTIVILSGSKEKLERFLQANPQLAMYFSQSIPFPDYTDDECLEMLKRKLANEKYEIPAEDMERFDQNVLRQLADIRKASGDHFGNAFTVNGILNRMMDARNARFGELLDQNIEVTDIMLRTIDVEHDLPALNA